MNNILVYGNWRTGTNLLINLFRKDGKYFNFDEFYSTTNLGNQSDQKVLATGNKYLRDIIHINNHVDIILKINFSHVHAPSEDVLDKFKHHILIYRLDYFSSIISRMVAERRNFWGGATTQIQPYFKQELPIDGFETMMKIVEGEHWHFMNNFKASSLDYVIEHSELIDYINSDSIDVNWSPSNNYEVTNVEVLRGIFNQNIDRFKPITEHFLKLTKTTNKMPFRQFHQTILENNERK